MSKPKLDKNIQIPNEILKDLLTDSEVRMLKNRWQIVQKLQENLPIRRIAEEVKVGTDTVVRVSKMVKEAKNLKLLSQKQTSASTSWIFGKSE